MSKAVEAKKAKKVTVARKGTVELDPSVIRFTHSKIRPVFTGCYKRVEETIQEILDGVTSIKDIPLMSVIENDGEYFALNNRRLYVVKHLHSLGQQENDKVEVYLKTALEREKKRFTAQRCSLHAKLMPQFEFEAEGESDDEAAADKKRSDSVNDGEASLLKETNIEGALSSLDITDKSVAATVDAKSTSETAKPADPVTAAGKPKGKPVPSKPVAAPLPADIAKEIKDLAKLVTKGKQKAVMSQIDEWEIAGKISEAQRDSIFEQVGIVIKSSK